MKSPNFRLSLSLLFLLSLLFNTSHAQSPPTLIFENGEAQKVPAFSNEDSWLKEEMWVEAPFDTDGDGKPDRIHVMVTRPALTDTFPIQLPVVYAASPYYGLSIWALIGIGSNKYNWKVQHELGSTPKKKRKHSQLKTNENRPFYVSSLDRSWVPRGYIMVYSSSPGTGLSDGAPTIGGENESLAPKAVIDWLCGRAKAYTSRSGGEEVLARWSSGKVGMIGTSYDGSLCIAAATTGVPGLEAIIPVAPVTSFYQYYRSNGLVRSPGGYLGEDMDVLYDAINTGDENKRHYADSAIRDGLLVKKQDRITGDYNDFWASRDYVNQLGNMKAALLMAHGFNDWNVMPEHSFRFYEAAKKQGLPTQLYYHQGDHGGDPPMKMMNRWFTRYLHGIQNGVENDMPVQIVRERAKTPTAYSAYPDPAAKEVVFYLQQVDGQERLSTTAASGEQPKLSLVDDYRLTYAKLLEAKHADHRLLFVTPTLTEDVRISGVAQVKLKLASSKAAANLSVYLVALPYEEGKEVKIYDNLITRGWADPQNHSSLTQGTPLVPGTFYEVNFDLNPDDQIIPAGKQIGLLIFSSDKDFTIHPKPGTQLTVDLEGSSISIPIVGGFSHGR